MCAARANPVVATIDGVTLALALALEQTDIAQSPRVEGCSCCDRLGKNCSNEPKASGAGA